MGGLGGGVGGKGGGGEEEPKGGGGGGVGQFAEGVWWKRGGSVSDGGWHTNAHYVCWKLR